MALSGNSAAAHETAEPQLKPPKDDLSQSLAASVRLFLGNQIDS